MALDYAELAELENEIMSILPDKITYILSKANRTGRLDTLLDLLDMTELLKPTPAYETYRDGKIVVIGESEVSESVLLAIAQRLGIDKDRFELCLDYEKAQTYNYRKMNYAPNYRAVLFGPCPHSSSGKGTSGSVINEMEQKEGYPRIMRLESNHALKITKSNFRSAIEKLVEENYL